MILFTLVFAWFWMLPSELAGYANVAQVEEDLRANHGLREQCAEDAFTLSEICRTSEAPETDAWSDSHAMALIQAVAAGPTKFDFVQRTYPSCGPFPGVANHSPKHPWDTRLQFNDAVLAWILGNDGIRPW